MATIKSNGYSVAIGTDALKSLNGFLKKNTYSGYFIICDENTLPACLPLLIPACPVLAKAEIIEIEAGESSKTVELSALIWQTLLEHRADRNTLIINLGGGVVSDLGGFSASVYKRGIDFINLPTSLLAMADASVGAKTGIDFNEIKNAVGTFTSPKGVFIYPGFLNSLPTRHYKNGMAEIFKIALVTDKNLWQKLRKIDSQPVDRLIQESVRLKNAIVLKDPFDKGLRKILNFGHSVGHVIEALYIGSQEEILHGEAVVTGMLIESHIALQKKLITKAELSEITSSLFAYFRPTPLKELDLLTFLKLLRNDKKNAENKFRFSLPTSIGSCTHDVTVTETQIKKAFDFYNTLAK